MHIIVVPGMGCSPINRCNWYKWFAGEMKKKGHDCKLRDFPNANQAKESEWMPFVRNRCGGLGKASMVSVPLRPPLLAPPLA